MPDLTLIRHAQASFGAADYDRLSPLGHRQSEALGASLAELDTLRPVALFTGSQRRHRETLQGLAPALALDPAEAEVLEGLNEFDSQALLAARLGPEGLSPEDRQDRRRYFRILREAVIAWQRDEVPEPPERFPDFAARVRAARERMCRAEGPVLAVSSGGALSFMIADILGAPVEQMILLQLQMKNCAVSRLVGGTRLYLHSFNEMPHIRKASDAAMLTYA